MPRAPLQTPPRYLTTREVAELLRVKERKVYDLVAAGEIPHTRITGKLLFAQAAIMAWLEGGGTAGSERPAVLGGSHDPLLEWAVRDSGCGLALLTDGSLQGLDLFARGETALSGLHIPGDRFADGAADGWNIEAVASRDLRDCVLLAWAVRARGLIVSPGLEGAILRFEDIAGRRIALRQPGAGARTLFDHLAARAGLKAGEFEPVTGPPARTEGDAAAAVSAGEADIAIGIEAMARRFRLAFLPLVAERFDLLVDRRAYFTEPVQTLLAFTRSAAFASKAEALGGYDIGALGEVRWLSP